jgi:hypothetical protein
VRSGIYMSWRRDVTLGGRQLRGGPSLAVAFAAVVALLLVLSAAAFGERVSSEYNKGGLKVEGRCLTLKSGYSHFVVRDQEGNQLKTAAGEALVSTPETLSGSACSSTKGVEAEGFEYISTTGSKEMTYVRPLLNSSNASAPNQFHGFVATSEIGNSPLFESNNAGNGLPAEAPAEQPVYSVTPEDMWANGSAHVICYKGGSNLYQFAPYGRPSAGAEYALMSWSWINVSTGGVARAAISAKSSFYPANVQPIESETYGCKGQPNEGLPDGGKVVVRYGYVKYNGSKKIYGWMVTHHSFGSSCYNHMALLSGPEMPNTLCPVTPGATEQRSVPIVTKAGEMLVFARGSSNQLLAFAKTGGSWIVTNISSLIGGSPTIASTPAPLETSTGELLVFARNASGELLTFARGAGGSWVVTNLTSIVAGNPTIAANPAPFETHAGELSVYARNAAGELLAFARLAGGGWIATDITSLIGSHPPIASSPAPFETHAGELLVYARNASGELLAFARGTGGSWVVTNLTSIVAGNPTIASTPAPFETSGGEVSVYAQSTANELLAFARLTGGSWIATNITSISPGKPGIASPPAPLETNTGELLAFAQSTTNELLTFGRGAGGSWSAYSATGATGEHIEASPAPIMIAGGELFAFARNSAHSLLGFARTTAGGWSLANLSALTGGTTVE